MMSRESADLAKILEIHVIFVQVRQRVRNVASSMPFDVALRLALRDVCGAHGLDPSKDLSMSIIVPANYWIGGDLCTQFWRGDQLTSCLKAVGRLTRARGRVYAG